MSIYKTQIAENSFTILAENFSCIGNKISDTTEEPLHFCRGSSLSFSELSVSHLSCNLCCKILILLLHTFANLETNHLGNYKVLIHGAQVLGNGLLAVLSLYIGLIQEADLL